MVRSNFLTNRFDFLVRFVSIQNEYRREKSRTAKPYGILTQINDISQQLIAKSQHPTQTTIRYIYLLPSLFHNQRQFGTVVIVTKYHCINNLK